jgi:hypothetical protein
LSSVLSFCVIDKSFIVCCNYVISCALHRLNTSNGLFKKKGDNKMKVVVRLAILVATLLLVANMAFAFCDQLICYDIVATYENGNTNSDYWEVCLYNSGTGDFHSHNTDLYYNLYLFGGGPGWSNTSGDPAIGGNPRYTTWIAWGKNEAGSLQPIGDGYMLTGEGQSDGYRYTIQGKKVPCM